jgi:hypothetical protein
LLIGQPPAGLLGQSGQICPSFPQEWHIILGFMHSFWISPRSPQLWHLIWPFGENAF